MLLRPYQIEAVDDLFAALAEKDAGEPASVLVALPTGTGKSLCIAATVKRRLMEKPNAKIIKATHSKTLVQQNAATLEAFIPSLRTGIYCAGLRKKETGGQVTYGSVQSMVAAVEEFGFVDMLIIDEAHLVPDKGVGQYRKFIAALRTVNPALIVVGFTATTYRLGLGSLLNGGMFDTIAHDATTPAVGKRGGEYLQGQLATSVNDKGKTVAALVEAVGVAADTRFKWLVFTVGIDHTNHAAEALNAMGVSAVALHSKVENQQAALTSFTDGPVQALVSCDMITTGFDYPPADCIVMMRPTLSTGLWVQMLGRGTRPFHGSTLLPPKDNTLVLDFAGNTAKLGPIDDPLLPKQKGGGGGQAPVKACPECDTYNHASARECYVCEYEFPQQSIVVFDKASVKTPMASAQVDELDKELLDVRNMDYRVHRKLGSPDMLRVTYWCGLLPVHEYVCVGHTGPAYNRAARWWGEHAGLRTAPPSSAEEALGRLGEIKQPAKIVVVKHGRHTRVDEHIFTGEQHDTKDRSSSSASAGDGGNANAASQVS